MNPSKKVKSTLVKNLKFLLLSDLHMQTFQVEKIVEYWKLNDPNYSPDFVLFLGDFDNLPMEEEIIKNPQTCQESELRVGKMLKIITDYFSKSQHYFIPGNHDSHNLLYKNNQESFVDEIQKQIPSIKNLHKQTLDLDENLKIIGFGGSIPGFYEDKENKQIWDGYPFQNDQQYQNELEPLIKENIKDKDQILLMTHIGPSTSISSLSRFNSDETGVPIQGGSQYLSELIKNQTSQILINFHGHVHDAQGQVTYKDTNILNCGPVQFGQFSRFELQKSEETKKWSVNKVEFNSI